MGGCGEAYVPVIDHPGPTCQDADQQVWGDDTTLDGDVVAGRIHDPFVVERTGIDVDRPVRWINLSQFNKSNGPEMVPSPTT